MSQSHDNQQQQDEQRQPIRHIRDDRTHQEAAKLLAEQYFQYMGRKRDQKSDDDNSGAGVGSD